MAKNDHIALTLSGTSLNDDISNGTTTQIPIPRKSLRRSWNQLPRCQRNLIILGISAVCITLLLFLPGDQIIAENAKSNRVFPFRNRPEVEDLVKDPVGEFEEPKKDDLGVVVRNSLSETVGSNEGGINEIKNENVPQFKEINLLGPIAAQQNNIENVVKLPETQKSLFDGEAALNDNEKKDKINIQEIYINNNNNNNNNNEIANNDINNNNDNKNSNKNFGMSDVEEIQHFVDDRQEIQAAVDNPSLMPSRNYLTIDQFLNNMELPLNAQKQHFHGATNERQDAVVAAFKHSWNGYKQYAWGHDNLKPISQSSHDWFGLGLTIVDSLDTIYIMGLEDEFEEARNWVSESLTFNVNRDVNLFEVTIRVLGGLLSAYHLSGDKMFLKKSIELGNRLLPCFLSPSGIPFSDVNLSALAGHSPKWSPDSSTSEVTTIQLEFRDLSHASKTPLYEKVVNVVNDKVHQLEKNNGLVPIFINANTGTFRNYATISLGARGDSYYEYLLKQWIQTGRKYDDYLIIDYMRAVDGILSQLLRRTPKEKHAYIGELIQGKDFKPKMDHLTCYLPGTLLLGTQYGMPETHLTLARDLLDTCYQTYMQQPTKLAPEISYFAINENDEHDIYVKPNDAHNLLRPEFIESLYYFYVITGNRTYQDMGWIIFQAFEKYTKVANGYTSIGNVKNIFKTRMRDMMESFWLGETLKYFYLLFSDNRKELDLDKWIFNSEAHPLPVLNRQNH